MCPWADVFSTKLFRAAVHVGSVFKWECPDCLSGKKCTQSLGRTIILTMETFVVAI